MWNERYQVKAPQAQVNECTFYALHLDETPRSELFSAMKNARRPVWSKVVLEINITPISLCMFCFLIYTGVGEGGGGAAYVFDWKTLNILYIIGLNSSWVYYSCGHKPLAWGPFSARENPHILSNNNLIFPMTSSFLPLIFTWLLCGFTL